MKTVHIVLIGTAAAVAAVWLVTRAARAAAEAGPLGIGAAVGGAVVDAGAGVVLGIGDAVGLPRTSMTECERAKAEGRTWDASFACPASDFVRYLWS